jgi:hypothetical protein
MEHHWTGTARLPPMHRWTLLGIALALIVALVLPGAAAQARTATATVVDPADDNAGAQSDLTEVRVAWDGATLTLGVTFAAPTFGSFRLLMSESMHLSDPEQCATADAAALTLSATTATARLTSAALDDELTATAVWSGTTVSFVFTSPELTDLLDTQDPFACLSGRADGDVVLGAFDGKLLRITPAAAVAAMTAELSRSFGTRFDDALRPWLRCPAQQISPETRRFYASASCRFEFRAGRRFHGGSVDFTLVSGVLEPKRFRSDVYTKRLRTCRIAATKDGLPNRLRLSDRSLRASGSFGRPCGWLAGAAGQAGDLERAVVQRHPRTMPRRFTVFAHGTGTAGFEQLFRFPCQVKLNGNRYTFACSNDLGHRFVYAFTVTQKPKPKPPPPPPSGGGGGGGCDPSYAGACLDPNASDYDCAGGSGDGPLYVQGPISVVGDDHYGLDSDGDGVACES